MTDSDRCVHGVWEPACNQCKPIHTHKDQLWNFDYTFKQGDRHHIHSKAQFDRECGRRGLVRTSTDDLLDRGQPSHPSRKPIDTSPIQKQLGQIIGESRNKDLVNRKWNELQQRKEA